MMFGHLWFGIWGTLVFDLFFIVYVIIHIALLFSTSIQFLSGLSPVSAEFICRFCRFIQSECGKVMPSQMVSLLWRWPWLIIFSIFSQSFFQDEILFMQQVRGSQNLHKKSAFFMSRLKKYIFFFWNLQILCASYKLNYLIYLFSFFFRLSRILVSYLEYVSCHSKQMFIICSKYFKKVQR